MPHPRPRALSFAAGGLLLSLLLLPSNAHATPMNCIADTAASRIQFTAHTKIFDATGTFRKFDVNGTFDPDAFATSKFTITIDTKSLDTDNGTRDGHLKSDDFFDVDKHPKASFTVTSVAKGKKPDVFVIKGTLNIKGKKTTHSIPMKVSTGPKSNKDPQPVTTLKGTFQLDRNKVGIDWPGSLLMPDIDKTVDMDVVLVFKHSVPNKGAAPAAPEKKAG
jgi:polyisoprenoid-binding protein YceI